jgi:glucosylceramidase
MRACVAAAALLAGLTACVPPVPVHTWVTTADHAKTFHREPDMNMDFGAAGGTTIWVSPETTYQTMIGFGASMTDASAYVIEHSMTAAQRDALMRQLFGRNPGLGISFVRVPFGSSDFSQWDSSYDDVPGLEHFSLRIDAADKIPVLRQALAINPQLFLLGSPWSAPGWMKTTNSMVGGTLRPDRYAEFAEYMTRAVQAFDSAGVPIKAITLQNEPHYEPQDYPGMRLEAPARAEVIARYLGPRMQGLAQIWDWDHNWDFAESPLGVLADSGARRYVQGVAWHCYAGDVSAQTTVHQAYPDKDVYFTECSGGDWRKGDAANLAWAVGTMIIGTTRNWARTVAYWNLALGPDHGPHFGGCTDCRGVVTIDATGKVTRNVEYTALAHVSTFVRPGAVRIASTSGVDSLATVAFQNPGDHSIALIVFNEGHATRDLGVRVGNREFFSSLPAASVATFTWR